MLLSNKHRLFPLPTGLRQSSLLWDHTIYATSSHHYHILPGSTKGTPGLGPIFQARWSHIYWPLLHSGFRRVFDVRVWGRSFILPSIMPYFTLGWPQAIWLNYLHRIVARNIHQVVGWKFSFRAERVSHFRANLLMKWTAMLTRNFLCLKTIFVVQNQMYMYLSWNSLRSVKQWDSLIPESKWKLCNLKLRKNIEKGNN